MTEHNRKTSSEHGSCREDLAFIKNASREQILDELYNLGVDSDKTIKKIKRDVKDFAINNFNNQHTIKENSRKIDAYENYQFLIQIFAAFALYLIIPSKIFQNANYGFDPFSVFEHRDIPILYNQIAFFSIIGSLMSSVLAFIYVNYLRMKTTCLSKKLHCVVMMGDNPDEHDDLREIHGRRFSISSPLCNFVVFVVPSLFYSAVILNIGLNSTGLNVGIIKFVLMFNVVLYGFIITLWLTSHHGTLKMDRKSGSLLKHGREADTEQEDYGVSKGPQSWRGIGHRAPQ